MKAYLPPRVGQGGIRDFETLFMIGVNPFAEIKVNTHQETLKRVYIRNRNVCRVFTIILSFSSGKSVYRIFPGLRLWFNVNYAVLKTTGPRCWSWPAKVSCHGYSRTPFVIKKIIKNKRSRRSAGVLPSLPNLEGSKFGATGNDNNNYQSLSFSSIESRFRDN